MSNLYLIRNVGCDDTTVGFARMTEEQLNFFTKVIGDLNANSTYGCMPELHVYRIDEDMIREATDEDDSYDVLMLDGGKYVLKDWTLRYGNEMEKVI